MKDKDEKQIISVLTNELISSQTNIEALTKFNDIHLSINSSKDKRRLIRVFLNDLNSHTISLINSKSMKRSGNTFELNKILYYKEEESYVSLIGYFMGSLGDNPTIKTYTESYKITTEFLREYTSPTTSTYDILTKAQIDSILSLPLLSKVIEIITKERPLSIFNFNLVNELSNSSYLRYINTIIQSRYKHIEGYGNKNVNVFMHELGHALHFALTHDIAICPYQFEEIFEVAFDNRWCNVSESDRPEVFADFFTIAASCDSEYEDSNHLIELIPREATHLIKKYFNCIMIKP